MSNFLLWHFCWRWAYLRWKCFASQRVIPISCLQISLLRIVKGKASANRTCEFYSLLLVWISNLRCHNLLKKYYYCTWELHRFQLHRRESISQFIALFQQNYYLYGTAPQFNNHQKPDFCKRPNYFASLTWSRKLALECTSRLNDVENLPTIWKTHSNYIMCSLRAGSWANICHILRRARTPSGRIITLVRANKS